MKFFSNLYLLIRQCGRIAAIAGVFCFVFLSFYAFFFFGVRELVATEASSVVINEVAWMGTKASPADEWVELFNSSADLVDLTGWGLYEGGGSVLITELSGSIDPNAFYLIERTDDSTVSDIAGDRVGSWGGSGLSNKGEHLVLKDDEGNIVDELNFSTGWPVGLSGSDYRTMERNENGWHTNDGVTRNGTDADGDPINGTPRITNSPPAEGEPVSPEVKPTITFSTPSATVAGKEFSVNVQFSNFEPGTYAIKVLVGKNGSFIFGNTKGSSGWLTQNGAWTEMPGISIGSSGPATKTIKVKVDDDAAAGSYVIKVRASREGENYDSGERSLTVSAAPAAVPDSSSTTEDSATKTEITPEEPLRLVDGEVLGEEAYPNEGFKLNFYVIVGTFGLIVGGGGLALGFHYLKNNSVAAR